MKFINLTPHTLNILDVNGNETIIPMTQIKGIEDYAVVLRVDTITKQSNMIELFEVTQNTYGGIVLTLVNPNVRNDELPIPKSYKLPDADYYIVSQMTLTSLMGSNVNGIKCLAPGKLLTKEDGSPIAKGFIIV